MPEYLGHRYSESRGELSNEPAKGCILLLIHRFIDPMLSRVLAFTDDHSTNNLNPDTVFVRGITLRHFFCHFHPMFVLWTKVFQCLKLGRTTPVLRDTPGAESPHM